MTHTSRRRLLQAAAVTAVGALAPPLTAAEPVMGMIFPPADAPVPPEAKLLYPHGVTFLAEGLAFNGMTIESYDEAVPRVVPAALTLKRRGATAISIMGTSLTFYKGAAFNQELIDRVHQATGLPATSMSSGIVDGLKVAGAKRIAVATAYSDIVNATFERFLQESGFQVLTMKGLNRGGHPDYRTLGSRTWQTAWATSGVDDGSIGTEAARSAAGQQELAQGASSRAGVRFRVHGPFTQDPSIGGTAKTRRMSEAAKKGTSLAVEREPGVGLRSGLRWAQK